MEAVLDWIATIRDCSQTCDPYAASILPLRKMIVELGRQDWFPQLALWSEGFALSHIVETHEDEDGSIQRGCGHR